MKTLAEFFIKNGKLTVVLSLGMALMGLMGLKRMNAESFPSVSMGTATIITSYDGATAEDIETKITKPIEDEVRGVTGLKDVKSISQAGLSTIIVRIDIDNPKVDVDKAMSDIQKALDRTTGLPSDLREAPTFTEINSEEFPVLELAIIGSNKNRERDLVADLLKEELEDHKSIKNVRLSGFSNRAFQIRLDMAALSEYHISIDEVLGKIQARNTNTPGGALKGESIENLVRIEGKISNTQELEDIVIRSNFSGKTVYLKDLALVEDTEEEIPVRTRYNGKEATLLIVTKKAGEDTISMVDDVFAKLENFKKRHQDYEFIVYNNESTKVRNKVEVLANNAISGLLLVVIFLLFFLPGKIGIAASLSLPLAVMGTLGMMPSFGMNLDTITVLALVIALGMLVDNSVVLSENFTRLRQEGMDVVSAAVESVAQLWLPITATAFTTIAAFLPMLVTKGVMGQFIRWIPIVVTLSLLLSLVESFFFLPMRLVAAGKNVKEKIDGEHTDWFGKFEHKFEKFMEVLVAKRYFVLVIFSFIIGLSFFLMVKANKFILFPSEQTEIYVSRFETPRGTRLEKTYEAAEKLSIEIKKLFGDQVTHVVARAGVAQTGPTDPKRKEGSNVGMLMIYVNDELKYNSTYTEVLKKMRTIKVSELTSLSFEEMANGPPVGNAIEATFRSNDSEELSGMIEEVKNELSNIPGIIDLSVDDVYGEDKVYVDLDYEHASRLNLNVNEVGQTVRTAVSGKRISMVTLKNKDVDLIVRLKEKYRQAKKNLSEIPILDKLGNLVPLGSFAHFRTENGSPQIKRFDFKRSKTLLGNVDENEMTSMVANKHLIKAYDKFHSKYPGVSLVFGGAAESTKESMESLFNALVLSLIGIFALLVFLFRSYLRPAIIMTTIPLGLFGFSIAFYFHDRAISFLALIGIIGLGGIIVNSGIVLISFIEQMRDEGKMPLQDILVRASGMRLRAVLVTSLTTISGLLPTAYGIGGSDPVLIPMTLAMAWGLTSGTVLTLVWVPCAYAILEDATLFVTNLFRKEKQASELAMNSEQAESLEI